MYQYTLSQWILFFFWYCFIGWIWECCFVSIKKAIKAKKWRWINRGFLNGPILPIYGSAAIAILLATIPVKDSVIMIFLLGMIAATLLELVTGSVMEKLFHVKYWDYSNLPLNFRGHICLFVSLFWGLLAIFVVKVIHVPVEGILIQIPGIACEILAFILVAIFAFDFSESFREAWDMRDLLEKLTDAKESMERLESRLENRVDAVIAFTAIPDIDEIREFTGNAKEKILFKLDKGREKRIAELNELKEKLHLDDLEELFDFDKEERRELKEQLEEQIRGVFRRTNNQYLHATKHLKRNPSAISKKYAEALKEIKELFEDKE